MAEHFANLIYQNITEYDAEYMSVDTGLVAGDLQFPDFTIFQMLKLIEKLVNAKQREVNDKVQHIRLVIDANEKIFAEY